MVQAVAETNAAQEKKGEAQEATRLRDARPDELGDKTSRV